MAIAYSKDFRELALKHWSEGMPIDEICAIFKIHYTSLYEWRKRKNETGDVSPRKRANKPRKVNYAQLEEIVKNNPDWTLKQMAEVFNMSQGGICKALGRMGISLKKRQLFTKKQIQSSN